MAGGGTYVQDMDENLLYGPPRWRDSGRRRLEEPGRFLLDFETGAGMGDGHVVRFTNRELRLLGRLMDRWATYVPDSEIAEIFDIEVPAAQGVAEELSDKLRRICGPWSSPIKVMVDGYRWDNEALVTVWGR